MERIPIFRESYDILLKANATKGSKQYLEILNYSAITNEQDVAMTLERLVEGKTLPSLETIRGLINQTQKKLPCVAVCHPNLAQYDCLIRQEKVDVAIH